MQAEEAADEEVAEEILEDAIIDTIVAGAEAEEALAEAIEEAIEEDAVESWDEAADEGAPVGAGDDVPADEAVAALADAEDIEAAEVLVEDELLEPVGARGRVALRPARQVVRAAHAVRLREQGAPEHRGPHQVHGHGGRIHEIVIPMEDVIEFKQRQEGRRPEEDVPRLPADPLHASTTTAGT